MPVNARSCFSPDQEHSEESCSLTYWNSEELSPAAEKANFPCWDPNVAEPSLKGVFSNRNETSGRKSQATHQFSQAHAVPRASLSQGPVDPLVLRAKHVTLGLPKSASGVSSQIPIWKAQVKSFSFSHPGYLLQGKGEANIYGPSVTRQVLLQTCSHVSGVTGLRQPADVFCLAYAAL